MTSQRHTIHIIFCFHVVFNTHLRRSLESQAEFPGRLPTLRCIPHQMPWCAVRNREIYTSFFNSAAERLSSMTAAITGADWRTLLEQKCSETNAPTAACSRLSKKVNRMIASPEWYSACGAGGRGSWSAAAALLAANELSSLLSTAQLRQLRRSCMLHSVLDILKLINPPEHRTTCIWALLEVWSMCETTDHRLSCIVLRLVGEILNFLSVSRWTPV